MLGDDPDPTVTTVRVGFGEVFGRTPEGGRWLCREGQTVRQQRIENPVRLRMVNERKGGTWQLRADASFMKINADDAMMNAISK